MNVALKISQFEPHCVWFRDVKKNMVIEGNFTKIIYAHEYMTLVGLIFVMPIYVEKIDIIIGRKYIHFFCENMDIVEYEILDTYQKLFNCMNKVKKTKFQNSSKQEGYMTTQSSLLDQKRLLVFPANSDWGVGTERWQHGQNYVIQMKVIGVWESDMEVGITYKYIF